MTSATITGDGSGLTNINGGNIQTDTITATQIAANAVSTSELNAGAVTAAKIAAGTITATEIASDAITSAKIQANAVTASKINVSSLSAISADIGSITAGSIDGVTITAGSGNAVTINSSGITLVSGTGSLNEYKWSDGSGISSSSDVLDVKAAAAIQLRIGASGNDIAEWDGSKWYGANGENDLGGTSNFWRKLYVNDARLGNLSGSGNDYVCVDADGDLFRSDTAC